MSEFWQSALKNTVAISMGVLVLSLLIAIPLAWLVERSDLKGANWIRRFFTLPYVVPSYLLAVAWISLANPDVGWLNIFLEETFGLRRFFNIYGIRGVILVEGTALSSILFLSLSSGMRMQDPSLEESALMCGASRLKIIRLITLPLLKQHLILGMIAVFLATLASFGVPAMIGSPARIFVLTTGIYSLFQNGTPEAFQEALRVSALVTVSTIALVAFSRAFFKEARINASSKSSRPLRWKLGQYRLVLSFIVWIFLGAFIILPLLSLFFASLQSDVSTLSLSSLSLDSWKKVLFLGEFRRALFNSFLSSSFAAIVILLGSLLFSLARWKALVNRRTGLKRILKIIEELSFAIYSLPGTVIALLLILLVRWMGLYSFADSILILSFAYTLKYFSLGLSSLSPTVLTVHPSLIEAAKLCGAQSFARFKLLWLPLLKSGIMATLVLILMPAIGELTMTKLLAAPASQNLGVLIFELHDYADRASSAVVACLLMISVFVLQYLSERISGAHVRT